MNGQAILQVCMAAAGALGFSLLYRISGFRLAVAAAGGAFNWIVYLLAMAGYGDRVFAFFLSALTTAVLAEVLARPLRTPVLTLLVPMLIPLVPGGDLYYTTLAFVQNDMAGLAHYGGLVLWEAGAISFGIILVACVMQTLRRAARLLREEK